MLRAFLCSGDEECTYNANDTFIGFIKRKTLELGLLLHLFYAQFLRTRDNKRECHRQH